MTVFAPSPVNPPQIPFTSTVGRAHSRSRVLNPASPHNPGAPIDFRNFASEWGREAIALRSAAVSLRTLS